MQLIWLRSDLRIDDNTALSAACQRGPTAALWIASPGQWQAMTTPPARSTSGCATCASCASRSKP
jgi:deoxyribodipyrimidine photo-lyase